MSCYRASGEVAGHRDLALNLPQRPAVGRVPDLDRQALRGGEGLAVGVNATALTASGCSGNCTCRPLSKSQIRIVRSSPPDWGCLPSLVIAMSSTSPECPRCLRTIAPVRMSQDPDDTVVRAGGQTPSIGPHAIVMLVASIGSRVARSLRPGMSQTLMVRSSPLDARMRPLSPTAILLTPPTWPASVASSPWQSRFRWNHSKPRRSSWDDPARPRSSSPRTCSTWPAIPLAGRPVHLLEIHLSPQVPPHFGPIDPRIDRAFR